MNNVTVSKFEVTASGILTAEFRWDPADPANIPAKTRINVPNGGLASIGAGVAHDQGLTYITVRIVPDDVPYTDILSLPINPENPLPLSLIKSVIPSIGSPMVFYKLKALKDTKSGFRLTTKR